MKNRDWAEELASQLEAHPGVEVVLEVQTELGDEVEHEITDVQYRDGKIVVSAVVE